MEYAIGKPGRVIVARLFEGEDPYACIEQIARKENIRSAAVTIVGGFRKAEVVVGPKLEKPQLKGDIRSFAGPGEVLGVGTIYCDEEGPKLHLHGAMGRGDNVVVGCPRISSEVFLVLEVTIIEITGISAARLPDNDIGVNLLRIDSNTPK
ncbi:MAG: DUF296 domain-containing protein [Sedimentisphaerales bacterium]|nr:DUF296 domain-containing protein [Sedimentisphaerales bacterium]